MSLVAVARAISGYGISALFAWSVNSSTDFINHHFSFDIIALMCGLAGILYCKFPETMEVKRELQEPLIDKKI